MPPLIAPEHDAGRGPGQRLTVSLSLIDGLGSLGWLVWLEFTGQNTGEDRAAERGREAGRQKERRDEGREQSLEKRRRSLLSLQLNADSFVHVRKLGEAGESTPG